MLFSYELRKDITSAYIQLPGISKDVFLSIGIQFVYPKETSFSDLHRRPKRASQARTILMQFSEWKT